MLRPPPVSTLFPYTTLFRSVEAMRRGQTKYTDVAGIPELRRAVCAKFKRDNGLEYEPADVLVACGAKHVLFNMVVAVLDPGDEVLIPSPYWVLVSGAGAPRRRRAGGGRDVGAHGLRPRSRPALRGGHAAHEGDRPQQPEQPDGRRLLRRSPPGGREAGGRARSARG